MPFLPPGLAAPPFRKLPNQPICLWGWMWLNLQNHIHGSLLESHICYMAPSLPGAGQAGVWWAGTLSPALRDWYQLGGHSGSVGWCLQMTKIENVALRIEILGKD